MGSTRTRPKFRLLRHLARTGGTLMSKCMGCMDSVVLLSEVHPQVSKGRYGALDQATEWFGLFAEKERKQLGRFGGDAYGRVVPIINERVRSRGRALVLRDWSHRDYLGTPYCEPAMRCGACEVLLEVGDVIVCNTVRHPLDQWLSLERFDRGGGGKMGFRIEAQMTSARVFAEECAQQGFVRYEDFTREPERWLREICDRLEVEYDAGWETKWASYETITGDKPGVGRSSGEREIRAMGRREYDPKLVEWARANEDYVRACALMGYEA